MHSFCKECFGKWKEGCKTEEKDVTCPSCRYILEKVEKNPVQTFFGIYEPEIQVIVRVLPVLESSYDEEDSEEEVSTEYDYPDEEEEDAEEEDEEDTYFQDDKYIHPYTNPREYLQDREDYRQFVEWFNRQ